MIASTTAAGLMPGAGAFGVVVLPRDVLHDTTSYATGTRGGHVTSVTSSQSVYS